MQNAGGPTKCIFAAADEPFHTSSPLPTNNGAGEGNYLPHCRAVKVDQKPFVRVEVKGVCKLSQKIKYKQIS